MKKLSPKLSLRDFAIYVAALLKKKNIDVILTGGAVVSIYSEGKYVSRDADFLSATDHQSIKDAMLSAGFKNLGKDFYHEEFPFTVEFPGSQLIIGDQPMEAEGEVREGTFVLKLLSPTQCVMDRLAAFYHWKDRQSLDQAILVASKHPIKMSQVEKWSIAEGMQERYAVFADQLQIMKRSKSKR